MSHQARTRARLQAFISRITRQIEERGDTEAPGVVFRDRRVWIANGQYGDPHAGNEPDFVRRDNEGWEKLTRR